MKTLIQSIFSASGKTFPENDAVTIKAINLLSDIIAENHSLDKPDFFDYLSKTVEEIEEFHEENEEIYSKLFDKIEELSDKINDPDFYFEYDGNEYRIIEEGGIWDIYVEEIRNIVEDCYSDVLKLDDIPSFISFEIDWEKTAQNAYVDGYGHTFSSYDGSEFECEGFYIFRTN